MSDRGTALIEVLSLATSSDQTQLAKANIQLEEWEKDPNFWLALLYIAFDQSFVVPTSGPSSQEQARDSIRTLAVIRFKNGIDKYWRSRVVARVTVTIPLDTKQRIKSKLLECLQESNRAVALQASVAISKIARYDYPRDWPDLFHILQSAMVDAHAKLEHIATVEGREADHIRSVNTTVLMRAADVCSKTLKELESVRILAGKMRMTELSRELLPSLQPIFQQYFSETFSLPPGLDLQSLSAWASTPLRTEQVRTSQLLLKAISRLAVADMGMISRSSTSEGGASVNMAQAFFHSIPRCLQVLKDTRLAFIRLLRASGSPASMDQKQTSLLLTTLTKHLYSFGKFFLSLVRKDNGKAAHWPGWTEVVEWYWVQAKDVTDDSLSVARDEYSNHAALIDYPPPFVVQALVLFKYSYTEWRGKATAGVFATRDFALEAVDVLVGRLMRLNQDDLERWQSDPEDWAVGEEQENAELDIRPAAERALIILAQHTKPAGFVGQELWSRFQQSSSLPDSDIYAILARDTIYAAVGRCRGYFGPVEDDEQPSFELQMGRAIANKLVPEARLHQYTSPMWVVIRRRIAWLLWEWSEQIERGSLPEVYDTLVSLLDSVPNQTDVAVRLAAARSLSAVADALEFDADGFEPFLPKALHNLATLAAASDLHEMESIKVCTDALSILIERMGPRIAPHADALIDLVPMLWQQEDPECKAKPSIIVFVSKVLRAIEMLPATGSSGALMQKVHNMVSPIVRESLHPNVSHLLAKDAISMLWIRALHSTSVMTQPLFGLLDLATNLIVQPDYCIEICRVIEETSMLNPLELLEVHGQQLLAAFSQIIADANNPMVLAPISALDTLLQSLLSLASWTDVCSTWLQTLDSTGVITALVGSLLHAQDAALISTHFVALLCRIAYHCPGSTFVQLVESSSRALASDTYPTAASIWKPILTLFCSRFENMASMRKRRVTALGLASLLDSGVTYGEMVLNNGSTEAIVACAPEMIAVWSELMAEITESRPLDTAKYVRPTSPIASMDVGSAFFDDLDDDDGWLQDISPGAARAQRTALADGTLTVRIQTHLATILSHAQHASPLFNTALQSMDSLVLDMFLKDLQAA